MTREIELLAPGGDVDSIKAAIIGGANAIYCGLDKFNARNRAKNISVNDLHGILRLAHKNNCKIFLTLNIIILENEIPEIISLLNKLVNTSIDGIIIQDFGLFYLLSKYFKNIEIHASTQLTTHNKGQIKFLSFLNARRINLSRELNIQEIKKLTLLANKNNVSTEVFVHGSNCICFSGICYMSSVLGGNSGNRGRCSQPCRDRYLTTAAGKNFPLNLKDNSAYSDLKELYNAGVASLKIEGRIKKYDYVYAVVNCWKKLLENFYNHNILINDKQELYKVFNRDFTDSYLKGNISKNMFIDDPRDHSLKHIAEINDFSNEEEFEKAQLKFYSEKENFKKSVEDKINKISIEKAPLKIKLSGKCNTPLKISVVSPDNSFYVVSEKNLKNKGTLSINKDILLKKFKPINDTEYFIQDIDLNDFDENLFIPFNDLNKIKKQILFILNNSEQPIKPIELIKIKNRNTEKIKPQLSVLISSVKDVFICNETSADVCFKLPNNLKFRTDKWIDFFDNNKKLIPWFPAILIDEDYDAAVDFLEKLQPEIIITNNTGIAYQANKKGISWIAGPYMNISNSYSILCLKENFNCCGAFISNELNKEQIKSIKKPEKFKLFYSIYHPIVLMTSRQCLLHQVIGCKKNIFDDDCINNCEKTAHITNLKNQTSFINKTKGNLHSIYNENNFLNTDIISDIPDYFSSFLIDLSDIKTSTKTYCKKSEIIKIFENILKGNAEAKEEIKKNIYPTIMEQYKKGI